MCQWTSPPSLPPLQKPPCRHMNCVPAGWQCGCHGDRGMLVFLISWKFSLSTHTSWTNFPCFFLPFPMKSQNGVAKRTEPFCTWDSADWCWGGGAGRRTGGLSWADMGGISETVSMEVHHTDPDSSLLCLWCCFEFTTIFWHPSSHPLAFGAGSSLLETCVGLTPQVGTDCSVPEEKGLSPSLICSCSVESCSPASLFPIDGYQCNPENGGSETGFSLTMRGCFFQGKGPDASATPLGKNMGVSALIFILHHCYVISFILSLLKKKDLFWEVQRSNIALKQEMSIIFYY